MGGLAFWYWLPAPLYFVLTMNIDELQLTWTALAFFWEVPVVGGAFVALSQRLYPTRQRHPDAIRRHRAALPFVEQMKNLAHGLVISLLLAVFYQLALDRGSFYRRSRRWCATPRSIACGTTSGTPPLRHRSGTLAGLRHRAAARWSHHGLERDGPRTTR